MTATAGTAIGTGVDVATTLVAGMAGEVDCVFAGAGAKGDG